MAKRPTKRPRTKGKKKKTKRSPGSRPQTKGNKMVSTRKSPRMKNKGDFLRVKHREFIANIYPHKTDTFKDGLCSFKINPTAFGTVQTAITGTDATATPCFPWLSRIAQNYEEWNPQKIHYQFISTCSDVTVSTSTSGMGYVAMATQYNVNVNDFKSKVEMQSATGSQSTKPSRNLTHKIRCSDRHSPLANLYVSNTNVSASTEEDRRFYDLGEFQIVTQNNSLSTGEASGADPKGGIGELWVDYVIDFYKPIFTNPTFIPGPPEKKAAMDHFKAGQTGVDGATTTLKPMGNNIAEFFGFVNELGGAVKVASAADEADASTNFLTDQTFTPDEPAYNVGTPVYYFPQGTPAGSYFAILWDCSTAAETINHAVTKFTVPVIGPGNVALINGDLATQAIKYFWLGGGQVSYAFVKVLAEVTPTNKNNSWVAINVPDETEGEMFTSDVFTKLDLQVIQLSSALVPPL